MDWQAALKVVRSGVLAFLALGTAVANASTKSDAPPQIAPSARIPASKLGYVAPSPNYLSLRLALTSLDFIDNDHLLFTFHANRLMKRIPGDAPGDVDQIIHAEVVDIATGKVTREADWRMHDRARYLWALNDERFLVRQRNSLFVTDEHLQLQPYLSFSTDLEGLAISPDRKLMLIEVAKILPPEAKGKSGAPSLFGPGESADAENQNSATANAVGRRRTELILIQPGTKVVVARSESVHVVELPVTDDGFIEIAEGAEPNRWALLKAYFNGKQKEFGTVSSSCMPTLEPLSEDVVLTVHCSSEMEGNHLVTAFSTEKGILWKQQWSDKYAWPSFADSEDGSRFAYESLETIRPIGTLEPPDKDNVKGEPVGVFDTETGKLELVEDASPILSGGQNFALSKDGRRFAILRQGAIEVYDLPPVPAQAKNAKKK